MRQGKERLIAVAMAIAASIVLPGDVVAGGFGIKERSTRAQGLSFAGASAGSGGLSSVGFNPAAIAAIESGEIAGGVSLIAPRSNGELIFEGRTIQSVDPDRLAGVANFYAGYRIEPDNLLIGVAVTNPFGLRTKYEADFLASGDGLTSQLRTLQFAPVVGLEVLPGLTLAAQGKILYADARLTREDLVLDGRDTAFSFAAGALWEATPRTTVGFAYDHGYDLELAGTAQSPLLAFGADLTAEAKAQLPATVSLGIVHKVTPDLRLMGEVQWQNWSVFDRIDTIIYTAAGEIPTSDPQNFRNAFYVALGGEYDLTNALTLRAGAAWDQTPTQDSKPGFFGRSVRVPDEDRVWLSVGGSYDVAEDVTIDAAYSYLLAINDPVVQLRTRPGAEVVYDGGGHIISVGGSFRF